MPSETAPTLQSRLASIKSIRAELGSIEKEAFMAAPPMPGGGAPPMDPAMMQGGGAPPMDPAMMGGAPPMDPAMMGGMPPVDPATGMPMDPAMMGGAPPMDPAMMGGMPPEGGAPAGPLSPEMIEELLGVIEELAAGSEQQEQQIAALMEQVEDLTGQVEQLGEAQAASAAVAL